MERLIDNLVTSMDPMSLVNRIAEQALSFIPHADGAAVTLSSPEGEFVTVTACGAIESLVGVSVPVRGSLQHYAAQKQCPQLISDAPNDVRLSPRTRALNVQWGTRSWVVIPLLHNDVAIGSLLLASTRVGAFTDLDVDATMSISGFVSALVGTHFQLSALLTDMLNRDEQRDRPSATRFLASVMAPEGAETHRLEERMDALLANPENVSAVFQPIIDLASGETVGFEGLSRFPAEMGLSPAQWFGTALRVRRGIALERAALHTIVTAARAIPPEYGLAVNLSPAAVLDPAIRDMVVAEDRTLTLEITEHEPFPDDLAATLQPLREHGVLVAVDDAGAGYASFTQLLRLRPDVIKIDGELVAGIDTDPVKRALVTALVALAAELNADTVAEAIETESQADVLRRMGIHRGQGFHLGPPRALADLATPPIAGRGRATP